MDFFYFFNTKFLILVWLWRCIVHLNNYKVYNKSKIAKRKIFDLLIKFKSVKSIDITRKDKYIKNIKALSIIYSISEKNAKKFNKSLTFF